MSLGTGSRLGSYEILGELGTGGMGVVYRAYDPRLNRVVAIKVPRDSFSERNKREARALAALSHPNICQIFDVGELAGGGSFLVMEHLDGETLAARISRGPLPLEQALGLAAQIAAGLHAAHGAGIVHRDLKPSNIVVTKSGAKILDFGLVRMISPAATDASTVPEITAPNQILGTLQYMAPEQLEGKEAGVPADVFAFGAVLFELLAGRKAFQSTSQAGVIAAVMSETRPSLRASLPGAPAQLERILQSCLARDPDARWQSMYDLSMALELVRDLPAQPTGAAVPAPRDPRRLRAAGWAAGVLLTLAGGWLSLSQISRNVAHAPAIRASILPPADHFFEPGNFALSPDGTRLAFVAVGPEGNSTLWVRALAGAGAQQFDAAAGASFPFWSPDGEHVGFFADRKLKTIEVASGNIRTICDAPAARGGGAWSPEGVIVFALTNSGPLSRVPEHGGVPAQATRLPAKGSGQSHRWPFFLPDGRTFLYLADWSGPGDPQGNGIYAASLDDNTPKRVTDRIVGNVSLASGHLIYGRDRSLRGQPFDVGKLKLDGQEVSIVEQEINFHPGFSHAAYSVSKDGVVIFLSLADSATRPIWLDTSGRETFSLPDAGYSQPRISPDGRHVVVLADDDRNGKFYVRVHDLESNRSTRLTSAGSEESPAWSRDGRFITYSHFDGKEWQLHHVPVDGSDKPKVLLAGAAMRHPDWSPAGHLAISDFSGGSPVLKVYAPGLDRERAVDCGPGAEARFSPDGNWLAHTSMGRVYVAGFPGCSPRIQISAADGAQPVWSRDGRRVYYIRSDRKLMCVDFDHARKVVSAPRVVAQTRVIAANMAGVQYDVASDGRILICSMPRDRASPLTLLTSWRPTK